jgi:hypothetical protein
MASTWLTVRDYDRLIRLANAREASVSAVMRHVVILLLNEEK